VNRAIAWFAGNHVAANLLMMLLVVGGLLSIPTIKQEIMPELSLDVVTVRVVYPGAAPIEIEEGICIRIEEELQGLQGVKRISSTAAEGVCLVSVELVAGEDVRRRLDEIRSRVDGIDSFPEEAEKPVIAQADIRFQVLDVAVSGDVGEASLKRLGQQVRDEISALPGITDVELVATRPYEVAIEVSEDALLRHDLSFDHVVRAVRRSSLDLPGGSVKTAGGEVLIRTKGQAYRGGEFEKLVLLSRPDGSRLRLGDVARVVDGFEETDQLAHFDGRPTTLVEVYRVGNQSALEVSAAVREYIEQARERLPAGVTLTVWQENARFLRARLDTLLVNGRDGFALVLLVLALFLRLRLAFWVSLGVPLSFLGALFVMPSLGLSINLISLMAFIVVLGIVVDDAIVVGENAYTEQSRGAAPLAGAIAGAQGIAMPVVFGVLTTIVAFVPMLFVVGPTGRMTRIIPMIVIACLIFSLIESLFVLPAHLAHAGSRETRGSNPVTRTWLRFQGAVASALQRLIREVYRPVLETLLEWRYLTVAAGVSVLLMAMAMLGGGWLRFVFQPEVEGEVAVAYLTMPLGTPVEVTAEAVGQLVRAAEEVRREVDAERESGSVIAHVFDAVGEQPYRRRQASSVAALSQSYGTGSHLGEVEIEVVPSEERDITVEELTRRWRERTGMIPGAVELSFVSTLITAGAPIHLELAGSDLDELVTAAERVKRILAVYPGVMDISDSFRGGKQEIELEILPEAEALGLTLSDLAGQVRQAFYGHEVQRIQRGRDDVKVVVRYPAEDRRSLGDLERMRIRAADGSAVPFSSVAHANLGRGFSSIQREDRRRVVSVTAAVDTHVSNANEIVADLKRELVPEIEAIHPRVQISFGGEQREQAEVLGSLIRGWIIALIAIYALLAVPLRSYLQPLIIMVAIPFGLVGAVAGHLIMQYKFSMMSVVGLVALSGVVVNDSLVLVDYVNKRRAKGAAMQDAIREAGAARFRAVLLTSLTTFAGLTPLLMEQNVQAKLLIPMGISLAFGVIFATLITLVMVPVSYLILEDLLHVAGRLLRRDEVDDGIPVEVKPAAAPQEGASWSGMP
jgi:multidrug efflux pump subunit AcrB